MTIENVTAVITDVVTQNGSNEYVWLFLILGGIIGTFGGIMLPYYREKRKFGKEGIDLLFDREFLKVGAGALVISVVAIGSIYPTLLENNDPSASYGSAFLAAATLAFTLNVGGSWIIGTNNSVAENQLIKKKAQTLMLSERLNNNGAQDNGNNITEGGVGTTEVNNSTSTEQQQP